MGQFVICLEHLQIMFLLAICYLSSHKAGLLFLSFFPELLYLFLWFFHVPLFLASYGTASLFLMKMGLYKTGFQNRCKYV